MKNNRQPKKLHLDKKSRLIILAEITQELTGEQEADIRGYLEKFGINAFFARLSAASSDPFLKERIETAYQDNVKNIIVNQIKNEDK